MQAKSPRKVALVAETALQRDLGKRHIGFDKEPLCMLEAPLHQIVVGRRSDRLFERPREVASRQTGDFGKRSQLDVLCKMGVDIFTHAAQRPRRQPAGGGDLRRRLAIAGDGIAVFIVKNDRKSRLAHHVAKATQAFAFFGEKLSQQSSSGLVLFAAMTPFRLSRRRALQRFVPHSRAGSFFKVDNFGLRTDATASWPSGSPGDRNAGEISHGSNSSLDHSCSPQFGY
jgi:hypothetical protein